LQEREEQHKRRDKFSKEKPLDLLNRKRQKKFLYEEERWCSQNF
jgi:hypothetical protein